MTTKLTSFPVPRLALTRACLRSTELFSYEDCIFYTVVTAVATLPRTELKARVVDAPEILTVIDTIPHLAPFLTALYACDYRTLFQARTAPYRCCNVITCKSLTRLFVAFY